MTPSTSTTCPKCKKALENNSKFCANCGNDVSGVWSQNPQIGATIAVEMDPNVDTLGQLLSSSTIGDYDIFGELGRGGMAAVYLAHDLALDRKVAIKTMLPELVSKEGMVARFKREAQTAAGLSHPHIIQIFTVKETKELCFFVMKFIEGRSLESVIVDKGKVPLKMTQTILGQVGAALDYAHRKKVVHRDIKPANIMIDEDGWAIVTDFGIAKVQEAQNLTATGTAIGTPHYMSPEQFHNKAVTGASDQYSLGVVLYEMLSGKKPFDGATYAEIITQHLFEAPPDITAIVPELPAHVNDVIKKMMAKDPNDRYADVDTAIHALGAPPTKTEGDVVRTQMISLAKSGPQKKYRGSVPMSPIPATKKRPAPAPTAIEPQSSAPMKKGAKAGASAEEKTGGAGKWAAIIAIVAVLGGGGYAYMNDLIPGVGAKPTTPAQQVAGNQTTTPPSTPAAPTDSAPATQSGVQAPAAAAPTAAVNLDSMAAAMEARIEARRREQVRQDSIRAAKAALAIKAKAADTKTNTPATQNQSTEAPRQTQAAPPSTPAPAAPQVAEVRIGSRTPDAVLYVNGVVEGPLKSAIYYKIPGGVDVKIQVRAPGCSAPYDTTVNVPAGTQKTIGMRGCQ